MRRDLRADKDSRGETEQMSTSAARRRMHLALEDAQLLKWDEGRQKYGPDWNGEAPGVELHEEALDALNYIDEAAKRGAPAAVIDPLRDCARQLAVGARMLVSLMDMEV